MKAEGRKDEVKASLLSFILAAFRLHPSDVPPFSGRKSSRSSDNPNPRTLFSSRRARGLSSRRAVEMILAPCRGLLTNGR
jgi:hypothetical protein